MDPLEQMMQYADDRDIYVHQHSVAGVCAMAFQAGGEAVIAIDMGSIETRAEQAVILAHEVGHIETGTLRNEHTRFIPKSKDEHRTFGWAVRALLPFEKLNRAISACQGRMWEVAEDLGLTEKFVRDAFEYYQTKSS